MNRAEFASVVAAIAGARFSPFSLALASNASKSVAPGLEIYWYARRLTGEPHPIGSGARHRMPAASLIKLVIAQALVDDAGSAGDAFWNRKIRIAARDVVDGSPTFAHSGGREATLSALMFAMLSQSDNTAANALLGHVGFARCNVAARALGLSQTSVERRFYDWAAQRRGFENYSSPRDMGELLAWFARTSSSPNATARDGAARVMRALYAQEDRETIPAALPGERIANKTGELPGYRHDAAIVGNGPNRYLLVAMTHFTSNRERACDEIRDVTRVANDRERIGA